MNETIKKRAKPCILPQNPSQAAESHKNLKKHDAIMAHITPLVMVYKHNRQITEVTEQQTEQVDGPQESVERAEPWS